MGGKKNQEMYTTIKLPTDLTDKIDEFIVNSDLGYTSRTDLIKTALRDFFRNKSFNCGIGMGDEADKK